MSLLSRPTDGPTAGWRQIDVPERGTTFAYDRRHRSRAAPTVVLLHGWTATGSSNWSATIAALEARYRVVALDHRGHGRGIQADGTFSLEDCADDVAALLSVLGVRRAVFVGYSMGGPVAQLIWRRHRHLVDGLVLCATAADFTSHVDEQLLRATDEVWRATGRIRRSTQVSMQVVSQLLEVVPIGSRFLEALAHHDGDAIRGAGVAIGRFCSTEWITTVDVPVVVIVTSRDRLVRPAQQRQLAALISGARTITVDAGHFAPFRQPELIAGAVIASCDSITQPSTGNRVRRAVRAARRLVARRRAGTTVAASSIDLSRPPDAPSAAGAAR